MEEQSHASPFAGSQKTSHPLCRVPLLDYLKIGLNPGLLLGGRKSTPGFKSTLGWSKSITLPLWIRVFSGIPTGGSFPRPGPRKVLPHRWREDLDFDKLRSSKASVAYEFLHLHPSGARARKRGSALPRGGGVSASALLARCVCLILSFWATWTLKMCSCSRLWGEFAFQLG